MGQIIESMDQAVTSKVSEVLDLAVLERLLEDTSIDFLPSLIEVFESESSQRLENITKAMSENDLATLGIEAHSLKGTSATFGAETLRSTAERIEKAAKSGDQSTVDQFVPNVPAQLESVLTELNRFSSALSA